jgi:ribonuclease Z
VPVEHPERTGAGLRWPWLNAEERVRRGAPNTAIDVAPAPVAAELRDTLLCIARQKVAYVVDTLSRRRTPSVIITRDADVFYCEYTFDEDIDQATRRCLTTRQAGARPAGARSPNVFHFSPRYEGRYGELVAEANAEYLDQQSRYGELGRGHAPLS